MKERDSEPLSGQIVDESTEITITELCRSCAVEAGLIEALIAEGILELTSKRGEEWCFSYISVKKTRTVVHLQRDLGVNLAGAALALDLMDQMESLKRRLQLFRGPPKEIQR